MTENDDTDSKDGAEAFERSKKVPKSLPGGG